MPKELQTQWDFEALAKPAPEPVARRVWSVSQLTFSIRRLLEEQLGTVWVTGEISNTKAQPSGHFYFTLKDSGSQINCVLFKSDARDLNRQLVKDGQMVTLQGELTVYESRGQYQIRVLLLEPQGMGALQIAFEKLKQKLAAEGLFSPERKKPIPAFPLRLGIVTSATGAAIRDVLHVIRRRHPGLSIALACCRVQGDGAAQEIAGAIHLLNEWTEAGQRRGLPLREQGVDLILLTRGGGSLEDLWAFNEEIVARAIAASKIPVLSAVGHEIDFTISDFAADLRASTPSAAAELITERAYSSRRFIEQCAERTSSLLNRHLQRKTGDLGRLALRLDRAHPRRRFADRTQRLDDAQLRLRRCLRAGARRAAEALQALAMRVQRLRPEFFLEAQKLKLSELDRRKQAAAHARLRHWREVLKRTETQLRLLSPDNVLERGYSITSDAATGKIIRMAAETSPGQVLKTKVRSGEVRSVVAPNPSSTS